MKKQLIITLLLLTLTGCAIADAELADAETLQIETQSDADTIAELIAELREHDGRYQAVIDALLADMKADRISQQELTDRLLDLIERQEQKTPGWAVGLAVLVLGIGGAVYFKRRPQVVYVLQPGAQPAGLLERGEWRVELEERQRVEVTRE